MPVLPSLPSLPSFRPARGQSAPPNGAGRAEAPARPSAPLPAAMVDCAAYIEGRRVEGCHDPVTAIQLVRRRGSGFVWVGFHEPDADEMAAVAELFGLHELAVEDAVHAYQRPKLEKYDTNLFLVLKTVAYVEHASSTTAIQIVQNGEIMIFVGRDFVVTVRHGAHSQLTGVRHALEEDPEQLALGPAAVMHAIADRIVDEYLKVVELVEDDIDEMENLVFTTEESVDTEQIYLLKREILGLRRAVAPLAAPLRALSGPSHRFVPDDIREYFRDVEDHLAQVSERVNAFDEMLTTLVNAALAEITTRQNEDLRKISSWAAIALVPTAIAGIYGMNFDVMPELTWTFGYPLVLGIIGCVCALLYLLLRRRGWL